MNLKKYLATEDISQVEFAKRLGVSPGAVWQWINGYKMAAENVLPIESATGGKVTRHDLRPDLYPRDSQSA